MMKFKCSLMAAALLAGTVVLSSCSSDELPVGNEVQQVATESAMTFSFSAPAMMGEEADTRVFNIGESSIDSRFSTEENVYVYIRRGDVIAFGCTLDTQQGTMQISPLHPDRDGKTCKLVADNLQYYTKDANSGNSPFTPQGGDEVLLYYGLTVDPSDPIRGYYDFETDGSLADVSKKDYCLAEMVVKSIDNGNMALGQKEDQSKEYFTFKNINSIFRQKITFFENKYSNGVPSFIELKPEIKKFFIQVTYNSGKMVQRYYPFEVFPWQWQWQSLDDITNYEPMDLLVLNNPEFTDGSYNIYFPMFFSPGLTKTPIQITAYDENNRKYMVFKRSPTDGFENNKYYFGSALLQMTETIGPVISGEYDLSPGKAHLDSPDRYTLLSNNPTISGNCNNIAFHVEVENTTVTLDNLMAENSEFEVSVDNNFTLNLVGDNVFIFHNDYYDDDAFNNWSNNKTTEVKLKCTGDKASLIIKTRMFHFGGFSSFDNTEYIVNKTVSLSESDLESMAADGFKVERSAVTDDPTLEGYKVYTYTVTKLP